MIALSPDPCVLLAAPSDVTGGSRAAAGASSSCLAGTASLLAPAAEDAPPLSPTKVSSLLVSSSGALLPESGDDREKKKKRLIIEGGRKESGGKTRPVFLSDFWGWLCVQRCRTLGVRRAGAHESGRGGQLDASMEGKGKHGRPLNLEKTTGDALPVTEARCTCPRRRGCLAVVLLQHLVGPAPLLLLGPGQRVVRVLLAQICNGDSKVVRQARPWIGTVQ